jgi:hypothetical protein
MKTIVGETVRYGAAAATTSFAVGLFLVYGLSVTGAFRYRRLHDPRIEFASSAGIGAAAFTFAWNFLARRHFLFVARRTA